MPKDKFPLAGTDNRPQWQKDRDNNNLMDFELAITQPKGRGAAGTELLEDLPKQPRDRNAHPTSVFFPEITLT